MTEPVNLSNATWAMLWVLLLSSCGLQTQHNTLNGNLMYLEQVCERGYTQDD